MLTTAPGCNKPSICIASVLPWSWTRGDRPLVRENTIQKHAKRIRTKQKGWFPASSTFLPTSWNLCLVHPGSFLFCNPNWTSRTHNFEVVSTTNCPSMKTVRFHLFLSSPNIMRTCANTLTWNVSFLFYVFFSWFLYILIVIIKSVRMIYNRIRTCSALWHQKTELACSLLRARMQRKWPPLDLQGQTVHGHPERSRRTTCKDLQRAAKVCKVLSGTKSDHARTMIH